MTDYPYPKAMARFPTLRQSLLSSFDNCALTASFEWQHRRGWSSKPQARGQIFHRFAGECLRTMQALKEEHIPVAEALEILQEVLRQDKVDRVCPHCSSTKIKPGISRLGRRYCLGCRRTFESDFVNVPGDSIEELHMAAVKWAHEQSFDVAKLALVEQQLKATLHYPHPGGGSVPRVLTGTVDAAFIEDVSHIVVIDWKDMWALPAEREEGKDDALSTEGYFQQKFYAWLVFKTFKTVERVTLRESYVRFTETREASITRDRMEELEGWLSALAERFDRAYEEKVFQPMAGKHCAYCLRPEACPIPVFARDEGRIVDEERAMQRARQILVAEQVLKKARKEVQAYTAMHGPLPITDAKGRRALGYYEHEQTLRPSKDDLDKAARMKGEPLTEAEIRALYRTRKGTKFGFFNPPAIDEGMDDEELKEKLEQSIREARKAQMKAASPPRGNVRPAA